MAGHARERESQESTAGGFHAVIDAIIGELLLLHVGGAPTWYMYMYMYMVGAPTGRRESINFSYRYRPTGTSLLVARLQTRTAACNKNCMVVNETSHAVWRARAEAAACADAVVV